MEFFYQKDLYFKNSLNNLNNLNIKNPYIDFVKEQNLKLVDGKYLESLIGCKEFIDELKNYRNHLGELLEIKHFIDKDFKKLQEKFDELIKEKNPNFFKNINKIQNNELNSNKTTIINKRKKKEELVTLQDYEKYYLQNGIFVYSDSIPWRTYPVNTEPPEIPEGEKQFLEKYAKAMEIGRRAYLGEENEDD